MNKVFISGMIAGKPELKMEPGEIPHLVLRLSIRHKLKSGEVRSELYRVSAWHNTARWGAENLDKGQVIGVQGYLTQRPIRADNVTAVATEIAVDEFLQLHKAPREESRETAAAPIDEAAC